MSTLKDPALQVGWVRDQLQRLGHARAADVLTVVLARTEQREEAYARVLLRVSMALAGAEEAGRKRAIACFAEARGQVGLARFLGGAGPDPDTDPDTDADDRGGEVTMDSALKRALSEKGRPLSLGERKSLARRRDRELLNRALRDPHPDVVRILLDNPALNELDVIRLCAQRPVAAEALMHVFRHPRWIVFYRVRAALAFNPFTPEAIALQLLPHLTPSDLKAVMRSSELSERVREACALPSDRSVH
ncbi:MAG TPA: hypothetical protein VFX59_05020 [Polyangiales bacterium]|nr:hypothetical protein [Polyangiales bacterium]